MNSFKLGIMLFSILVVSISLPMPALSDNLPTAKADMGLVVFYRPSRAKGAGMRFEIIDGAKGSIGMLKNGTVIQRDVEPGSHTFTTRAPSVDGTDSITINAEAGKITYVKGEIIVGWPTWRPKFSRVSESDAQSDLVQMKK